MRKVVFEGRERALATLCRELQIDRRTVESRLDRSRTRSTSCSMRERCCSRSRLHHGGRGSLLGSGSGCVELAGGSRR